MDHRSILNRAVRAAVVGHGRARIAEPVDGRTVGDDMADAAGADCSVAVDYPAGATVACDHAVFTSVRSPTGEGYRIIAASAGVSREERTEITRRSPSHGGLASTGANAVGLLTYRTASGRLCVSVCRYAGTEHTARGGRRVHTHALLLDDATFRRLGCNEIRAMTALLRSADTPIVRARPSLPKIELITPARPDAPMHTMSTGSTSQVEHLIRCLMDDGRYILTGWQSSWSALETAADMLPLGIRRNRSLMFGLTFAPTRSADVVLLNRVGPEAMRSVRGQNIRCEPAGKSELPHLPDADPWLRSVSQRLELGHQNELVRYVARLGPAAGIDALNRLARLLADLDSIDKLDDDQRVGLGARYRDRQPTNDVERELIQQIKTRTQPATDDEATSC